jgi:hypothetical protein
VLTKINFMTQANEPDVHAVLQALAEAVAAILEHPRRDAWTKAETAVKLGCTESWLEEQVRQRRIPFTRLSGAIHFTDAHIQEIIKVFEVRPKEKAAPVPAPATAAYPKRPAPRAAVTLPTPVRPVVQLKARQPRKRGQPGAD